MRGSRDGGVGNEAVLVDQRRDLLLFSLPLRKHRSRLFGSHSMLNVIDTSYSNPPAFTIPRHPVGPTFQLFRDVNASGEIGVLILILCCHGTYGIRGS